eukprot:366370-Chlamydomonas_euryale.AAC.2
MCVCVQRSPRRQSLPPGAACSHFSVLSPPQSPEPSSQCWMLAHARTLAGAPPGRGGICCAGDGDADGLHIQGLGGQRNGYLLALPAVRR